MWGIYLKWMRKMICGMRARMMGSMEMMKMGEKHFPKYEISVYEDKTSTIGGANVVHVSVKAPKMKECKKLYEYVKKKI